MRVAVEIDVKELRLGRYGDTLPGLALIRSPHQKRIDNDIVVTNPPQNRPDNIAAFFIRKPNTEKLRRTGPEITGTVNTQFAPGAAAVFGNEHSPPGNQITVVFVAKIYLVD